MGVHWAKTKRRENPLCRGESGKWSSCQRETNARQMLERVVLGDVRV